MIEAGQETIPKFESSSSCNGGTYYPSMYSSPELQLQSSYPTHLGMIPGNNHHTYGLMYGQSTTPYPHMSMHMVSPLSSIPSSLGLTSSYSAGGGLAPSNISTHGYSSSTTALDHSQISVADYLTPVKRPPSSMSDTDNTGSIRPPAKRAAQICLKCHQPRKGHVCPFKTRTPPKTYREFPVGQGDKVITCCPNCGIPLYSGSKYCHKCGSVNAVSGQTALSLFTTQRVPKLSPEEAQQLAGKFQRM